MASNVVAIIWDSWNRLPPGRARILPGNPPGPARAGLIYPAEAMAEVAALAGPGWEITCHAMPPGFFAAHHRYDAVPVRR